MRTGNLKDEDWTKLVEGADIIGRSNLIIDDTPGISIAEMRSKCRKYKLEHNLGIIMIDYLQLMSGSGKSDSRQQEISDISRSLKALAMRTECAGHCAFAAEPCCGAETRSPSNAFGSP